MIAPPWLATAVEQAKQAADLHTSSLSQAIARAAMTASWFPTHVAGLQAATRTKRDVLLDALAARLGDELETTHPTGGMFVWATFRDGTDTANLLAPALEHGVAFVPGAAFAVERPADASLRLSWATSTPDELTEAVDRLATAHQALTRA